MIIARGVLDHESRILCPLGGHDKLKIKNGKSVDNFWIWWCTNRREDLLTQNPFLILGGAWYEAFENHSGPVTAF